MAAVAEGRYGMHSKFAYAGIFCSIWSMTIRALEKEVLELPPRSRIRFAEKILESVNDFTSKEIEAAWAQEIERRTKEIESGKVKGVPARRVMAKARRALNEARHLSSARRK
jgi:putative addiction module component (TIGR02574 family)